MGSFKILDNYWDYTDYALLQRLVDEFGESALKKEMSEYVAALEQFEKGTTIRESSTAASNSRHPKRDIPVKSDSSEVKLQLPRDPAVCTLYEARELTESLAKRSCLEPYAVRLQ